jgi:hypothetical protein
MAHEFRTPLSARNATPALIDKSHTFVDTRQAADGNLHREVLL